MVVGRGLGNCPSWLTESLYQGYMVATWLTSTRSDSGVHLESNTAILDHFTGKKNHLEITINTNHWSTITIHSRAKKTPRAGRSANAWDRGAFLRSPLAALAAFASAESAAAAAAAAGPAANQRRGRAGRRHSPAHSATFSGYPRLLLRRATVLSGYGPFDQPMRCPDETVRSGGTRCGADRVVVLGKVCSLLGPVHVVAFLECGSSRSRFRGIGSIFAGIEGNRQFAWWVSFTDICLWLISKARL